MSCLKYSHGTFQAFALGVPNHEALAIREEVGFFQEIRSMLTKPVYGGDGKKIIRGVGNSRSANRLTSYFSG
jgi:hypothetical protein